MTTHKVKPGQHMVLIARLNKRRVYRLLWDDPANANLKNKRKNPNILLAGDSVEVTPLRADHWFHLSSAPRGDVGLIVA